MAEYTMDDIFEPVFITLGEGEKTARFRLRERTKKLGAQFDKLSDQFDELQEQRTNAAEGEGPGIDEAVYMLLDMVDVLLEPASENGTRPHAKTILKKSYDNDNIGFDRIMALLAFCQEQGEARLDPTQSRLTIDG
jgi:hypothetical protein